MILERIPLRLVRLSLESAMALRRVCTARTQIKCNLMPVADIQSHRALPAERSERQIEGIVSVSRCELYSFAGPAALTRTDIDPPERAPPRTSNR